MGKKAITVRKRFRVCSVDYAYINENMGVSYDTHQLDFYTTSKDLLARQIAQETGHKGITITSVSEQFNVYEMSTKEFKQCAVCVEIVPGKTIDLE